MISQYFLSFTIFVTKVKCIFACNPTINWMMSEFETLINATRNLLNIEWQWLFVQIFFISFPPSCVKIRFMVLKIFVSSSVNDKQHLRDIFCTVKFYAYI